MDLNQFYGHVLLFHIYSSYRLCWCLKVVECTCGNTVCYKMIFISKSLNQIQSCWCNYVFLQYFLCVKLIVSVSKWTLCAIRLNTIELRCKCINMIDNYPQNLRFSTKLCPDTRQKLRSFNNRTKKVFLFDQRWVD